MAYTGMVSKGPVCLKLSCSQVPGCESSLFNKDCGVEWPHARTCNHGMITCPGLLCGALGSVTICLLLIQTICAVMLFEDSKLCLAFCPSSKV